MKNHFGFILHIKGCHHCILLLHAINPVYSAGLNTKLAVAELSKLCMTQTSHKYIYDMVTNKACKIQSVSHAELSV